MSEIRIKNITIKNYRSFWNEEQIIEFPNRDYKKPVAIVWYNNAGKSNLMNAILYGIGEKYIWEKEFNKNDLHNLNYANDLLIKSSLVGSSYTNARWFSDTIWGDYTITAQLVDNELESRSTSFFWKNKHYQIFYVNFHQIKDQISTQKTSWWNIKSFLWKHINRLIEEDEIINARKDAFKDDIEAATKKVIEWGVEEGKSKLFHFIEKIKTNYEINLRNSACVVDFWLPDYEDIFLQMLFKIWLNWNTDNLVPINNFWDGFISMFVMSVIQAIAESNETDKCLFLFEEPESFLHENHQEYFYKTVLCWLAEKWHQVIYTTHSDKMIDIFDTKWLIRLENDDSTWTIVKYNDTTEFSPILDIPQDSDEEAIIQWTNEVYNQYIKNIEPNLNKILFSKKVILVEWPNDLMCYTYSIKKRIEELEATNDKIIDKKKYADTFLNFHNIVIIPHHWKATALLLIQLCKWIKVDYFVINDFDFEPDELDMASLLPINSITELKGNSIYTSSDKKWMITVNFNLIQNATTEKIHFNMPKLEKVINYWSDDKDAVKIWKHINSLTSFNEAFFPKKLEDFLLNKRIELEPTIQNRDEISIEDIPF